MLKPEELLVLLQPAGLWRFFPSLTSPNFRLLWLGMFLPGVTAWQMNFITMGYLAFTLSGSATVLGIVSFTNGIPSMIFSLAGGVAADRFSRRMVLLCAQGSLGLVAVVFAALTITDHLAVWHLVTLGLVQSAALAFVAPARHAYTAELAGPELLKNAVALNNAGANASRVVGPALVGALLAQPAIGPGGVYLFMTALYILMVTSLLRLPPPAEEATGASAHRSSGWAQLVEGLRYIKASPALLTLLGLGFLAAFLGLPVQQLMPVFALQVFDAGSPGLGLLLGAMGLGALAGAVVAAALTTVPRISLLQAALGVVFGLSLMGFALAPVLPLAVVFVALVGFASSGFSSLNNTLVMAQTEPRLYGRIASVYMLTFSTAPLAALPAAWLADTVGAPATVAAGGLLLALAVAAIATLSRPYRQVG